MKKIKTMTIRPGSGGSIVLHEKPFVFKKETGSSTDAIYVPIVKIEIEYENADPMVFYIEDRSLLSIIRDWANSCKTADGKPARQI